jgi:hypothetical protein
VTSEQQTVTVPVSHEEVRLEREPITDQDRDRTSSGVELTEEQREIVLHAERPVVTTESVPVERVWLDTAILPGEEPVNGDVRQTRHEWQRGLTRMRHHARSGTTADTCIMASRSARRPTWSGAAPEVLQILLKQQGLTAARGSGFADPGMNADDAVLVTSLIGAHRESDDY